MSMKIFVEGPNGERIPLSEAASLACAGEWVSVPAPSGPFLGTTSTTVTFTCKLHFTHARFLVFADYMDWLERRETQRRWLARMMKAGVN